MAREKTIYPFAEGLTTGDAYAVLGSVPKFKKHKHAWKVWRALKEFGCLVYPVAEDLKRLDGSKVYANITELKDRVTVIVPCLLPEALVSLVSEASMSGAGKIWFQEQTWSPALQQECEELGIQVFRGCVLRHKIYPPLSLRYLNPCYWHGLEDLKVPSKRFGLR
ncbi:CoA-binding protein [Desulfosporosinus sp. PR]|uniref:CoA-binding protein n=1 Tax=Candidatus Desulfosporosinus nitrosoreducens TaxID=3401928 RepID=UPI0027FAFC86|nr:CoA-binding protein [Desulfosporosinus sp. PR]MDQ7095825.1 CoA-binding protein [Desulfosporosinus sp. PR]